MHEDKGQKDNIMANDNLQDFDGLDDELFNDEYSGSSVADSPKTISQGGTSSRGAHEDLKISESSRELLRKISQPKKKGELDEDFEQDIIRQASTNRRASAISSLPSGVALLPDKQDIIIPQPNDSPGDDKSMRGVLALSLSILGIIAVCFGGYTISQLIKEEETTVQAQPLEQGPGTRVSVHEGSSHSPGAGAASTSVNVPEGGSLVEYRISMEGEKGSSSLSYIDGSGKAQQEVGVKLPWSKDIGAEPGTFPQIAVTSTGSGTLTCYIDVDGEQASVETSSGDQPTVECGV